MSSTPSETITFSCPHCGQHLAIDESMSGMELECPTCKQPFTASCPEEQTSGEAIVADNASKEATAETAEAEKTEMVPPSTETVESAPSEAEGVSGAKKADDGMPEVSRKVLFRENARKGLHKVKVTLVSFCRRVKKIFLRLPERAQGAVMASAVFLIGIAIFSGKGESTDDHDDVMRSFGKEDDTKAEKASLHPTSYSATPNPTKREKASHIFPRKPIGEERAQDEANSLYQEAMRYFNGDGVLKNMDKAIRLLKESSEKGSANANGQLALAYWTGVPNEGKSVKQAFDYAEKSGAGKTKLAEMVLGNCYLYGGDSVESDYPKAYLHFSKCSDTYIYARLLCGLMQYYGIGTEKNKEQAAETFFECCKGMNSSLYSGEAALCLGYMYAEGIGIERNSSEAEKWLKWGVKAAGYYDSSCRTYVEFITHKAFDGDKTVGEYPVDMKLVQEGLWYYYNKIKFFER